MLFPGFAEPLTLHGSRSATRIASSGHDTVLIENGLAAEGPGPRCTSRGPGRVDLWDPRLRHRPHRRGGRFGRADRRYPDL